MFPLFCSVLFYGVVQCCDIVIYIYIHALTVLPSFYYNELDYILHGFIVFSIQ